MHKIPTCYRTILHSSFDYNLPSTTKRRWKRQRERARLLPPNSVVVLLQDEQRWDSRDRWPSGNTARFTASGGKDNRGWIPWIDFEWKRSAYERWWKRVSCVVVRLANRASLPCVARRLQVPQSSGVGRASPDRRAAKRRGWTEPCRPAGRSRKDFLLRPTLHYLLTYLLAYLLTYLLTRTYTRDFLRLTAKSIAPGHGEVLYLNIGVFFKAPTSISTPSPSFQHFFLSLIRSMFSWLRYFFLFPVWFYVFIFLFVIIYRWTFDRLG